MWANRPSATGSYAASKSFAHGGPCYWDFDSIDVTSMVQAWASGALTNYGLMLQVGGAGANTNNAFAKRFCSMNEDPTAPYCTTSTTQPFLRVTYDTKPFTPSWIQVAPYYNTWVSTTTPTFSGPISDPDGDQVKATWQVTEDRKSVV